MGSFFADVRYGLRGLLARPVLTLVAVASLALGIGVNTAIYSLYHQVVMRPLPVGAPERLVNLSAPGPKPGNTSTNMAGPREDIFSYPMFRDLERAQTPFEGLAAHTSIPASLAYGDTTTTGRATLVSGAYFRVLGLAPALGRLLGAADDGAAGSAPHAVLGYDYWQRALGGAPDVIGRMLRINGQGLTIVGVAPRGFAGTTFGVRPDAFVPMTQRWALLRRAPDETTDRTSYWMYLFARLKPGIDIARAQADLNGIYGPIVREVELPLNSALDPAQKAEFAARRVELAPGARGQSTAARNAALPLALLLGAATLVLVVACLNIANLLLARGAARASEIALRASIGASRARLLRQLGVEAALLGLLGAAASLPLAGATIALLAPSLPMSGAESFTVGLDGATLRFTAAVALATTALFGLFPALQLAHVQPIAVLRSATGASTSRVAARFRNVLAVAQVAVSMASLVLAGLFLRSLINLQRVELGMAMDQVLTLSISPERNGYTHERATRLYDTLEEDLAAIPGVTSVATSQVLLLAHDEWSSTVSIEGQAELPAEERGVPYNLVGLGYFRTLGIPLLSGRDFQRSDAPGTPKVAIVNRRFVERYGLGTNPVGKRIAFGDQAELDIEIVGLVGDSKYSDLRGETPPQFFLPRRQDRALGSMRFYLRTAAAPEAILGAAKAAVARHDASLPLEELRTMPQQIDVLLSADRFVGKLALAFAALATALAALGLYGVLNYMLAQRTREIGLRLALGAAPRRLRRMVLGQVGRMTLVGGTLGLLAALGVGRAASTVLYGLEGHDPTVLAAACGVLAVVALLASWLPVRRVGRIDPMAALRHD